jgi:DNA-binding response OmpR family regulator
MRILLIEDDEQVGQALRRVLSSATTDIVWERSGRAGLDRALASSFDGLVLDLGLGDLPGVDIVRELRTQSRAAWILVLTGNADQSSIVATLDAGADDYVIKPTSPPELLARVRALSRRHGRARESEPISIGALTVDRLSHTARVGDVIVTLSPRELRLLEYLALHVGEIVTRGSILEHVWHMTFDPGTNVIDVHVARLRRKLSDAKSGVRIETVRAEGLRLSAE